MSSDLEYAKARLRAFLDEVNRLKDADFPYDDSRHALLKIEELFRAREVVLSTLTERNDPDVIRTVCSESLSLVFKFLPLLGFILRSTNVRNSFEVFGPLLRLARGVLGNETRLILSSEWEYSPHVYSQVVELPNFVFIGLPACESGNPMLLPLAGHEFGHAVWQQQQLERRYSAEIKQRIVSRVKQNPSLYQETFEGEVGDLLFESNISSAHLWGLRQAEETFCDCFGVRLFAESYLHSFAYVLAPGFAETGRVFDYPPMRQRVANIQLAASHFQVEVPTGFGDWFIDDYVVSGGRTTYLAELADRACAELVEDLIKKVAEVTQSAPHRSKERMAGAERMFLIPAPASRIGDLSSLLNAAWRAYENYVRSGTSLDSRKLSILFEVVLKSIEVLEIEARISHS